MLVNPAQPENAKSPMLVTLSGIVTFVSPVQLPNACSLILVTLSGIVTLVSPSATIERPIAYACHTVTNIHACQFLATIERPIALCLSHCLE